MKLLCFGDSNTYGYDPRSFFGERYPEQERWVDLLAEKWNWDVINAGENGREIPKLEWELRNFTSLLKKHTPITCLIIMLGTNDLLQGNSPEVVVSRMRNFLEQIDLDPSRILLIAPPPMQHGEWVPTKALIDASAELSRGYRSLSERLSIHFIDTEEWNIPLTFDGIHFTADGHKTFADKLFNHLTKIKPKEIFLCWKPE